MAANRRIPVLLPWLVKQDMDPAGGWKWPGAGAARSCSELLAIHNGATQAAKGAEHERRQLNGLYDALGLGVGCCNNV